MKETILQRIVRDKTKWIAARKAQQPLATFLPDVTVSERDFYQALNRDHTVFILECKKASPSKGLIRPYFNPKAIALSYKNYASVISVLTDEAYFQGSFDYLTIVSQTAPQPVLCKDFIIDPYQIYLARYYQADAILLMLSVLDDSQYQQLAALAHQLKMGVLTEVSNEEELHRAIQLQAQVVGINNRDLRDLSIDLDRTRHLASQLPKTVRVISESGIYHHQQIRELSRYADGFLIGSALMSDTSLDLAVRKILFGANKVCGLTRTEDAIAAYQAGAVFGGLIFASDSPRYLDLPQAQKLLDSVPLHWVGVFRHASVDEISAVANTLSLFAVQLHGDYDEETLQKLRIKLPLDCEIWLAHATRHHMPALTSRYVARHVLDNGAGGSGRCFDWQLLEGHSLRDVILAGGLGPDNVAQAATLGAYGLDFNSGVESSAGMKDHDKINAVFTSLHHHYHNKNKESR